jgi:hypothetical protein
MKFSRVAEVLVTDAILIAALLWVLSEQAARASYAVQEGFSVVVSRSLFYVMTTLSKGTGQLSSPPTLDWVQVLLVALIACNAYFAYVALRSRSR